MLTNYLTSRFLCSFYLLESRQVFYKHKLRHIHIYTNVLFYYIYRRLAEGHGVARGKKLKKKNGEKISIFLVYNTPRHPSVSKKNVSPIGPAVWPAIRNMYTNVFFYLYINLACLSVCLYPINVKTAEPIGLVKIRELFLFCFTMYTKRTCSQLI